MIICGLELNVPHSANINLLLLNNLSYRIDFYGVPKGSYTYLESNTSCARAKTIYYGRTTLRYCPINLKFCMVFILVKTQILAFLGRAFDKLHFKQLPN